MPDHERLLRRATAVLIILVSLGLASTATAVTFEWVTVGDPGNACDDAPAYGCYGDVAYVYRIGKYEVTNAAQLRGEQGGEARV
jgi:hypothetical protein